ncbi:MAG: aldo/keto reductase [Planctomycetia bacterium]|nr:aldo/keto reductase [Planctomycetia bacterium]
MQYVTIGTTEMQGSVIALGTWAAGGWMWGGTEEKEAVAAIRTALEHGVNLIDTAPVYGFGRSEEIVAKALEGFPREKVLIATKCGLAWTKEEWPKGKGILHFYTTEKGEGSADHFDYRVYKYLRPESIRKEVEESLRRLQTDYIDLLQTHWQDETSCVAETMETMMKLKEEGKIRAVGISNTTCATLEEYEKVGRVEVIQERYSLLDREIEENGLLEKAKKEQITLLPYSPLCRGLLTGRMAPERVFGEGDRRSHEPRFSPESRRQVNEKLAQLQPLAEKHGLTQAQLVIAWTFSKYPKTNVLCGSRTPHQVLENVAAGDARLSTEEIAEIESVFAAVRI